VWNTGFPPPYTWATTDITNNWWDTTNTLVSRQGPCPSGYHIPSQIEWEALVTDWQWGMDWITLSNTLKLPFAWSRLYYNGSIVQAGDQGNYWSSTPLTTTQASNFYVTPGGSGYTGVSVPNYNTYKSAGFSVRCFKN
jgi:uncharacterized protein (TIGR02145 family)